MSILPSKLRLTSGLVQSFVDTMILNCNAHPYSALFKRPPHIDIRPSILFPLTHSALLRLTPWSTIPTDAPNAPRFRTPHHVRLPFTTLLLLSIHTSCIDSRRPYLSALAHQMGRIVLARRKETWTRRTARRGGVHRVTSRVGPMPRLSSLAGYLKLSMFCGHGETLWELVRTLSSAI